MNLTQRALLFDGGNRLPKANLLIYLSTPNSAGMFLLPSDADIRAATGWISGTGNIFYDAAGDPIAVYASEIAAWASINQWNVLFHLVSADTESGRLAIYAQDTPLAILNKALKVLREGQIDVSPSAFFNGMDFRLSTYTGGPTYALNHLGGLSSPGSNRPAIEGMRLITTVEDGAVLGPELTAPTKSGEDAENYIEVLGGGRYRFIGDGGTASMLRYSISVGRRYKITLSNVVRVAGSLKCSDTTDGGVFSSVIADFTTEYTVIGDTLLDIVRGVAGQPIDITVTISVKEVIPTYLNTGESGDPIIASTPQKTVTYNTDWTAKIFAETFDKFDISNPLKAPGWLCEPVRTNKCTCRKANPVDISNVSKVGDAASVLSVVDDTAALEAAGLKLFLCTSGKVYKLNNSAGVGYAAAVIAGACANTNPHSVSIYTRITGGTGEVKFNNAVVSTITLSEYSKLKGESINPADATKTLSIVALAGAIVYFILPDLQEGAFATSPICKAADGSDPLTSLTRAATIASFPTAGKIPVNNFAIRMIVVPRATGQDCYVISSRKDASNSCSIAISPDAVSAIKRSGGINTYASSSVTHASGIPIDILFVSTSSGGMQISSRIYPGVWGIFTESTANNTEAAKADAQIGLTYQLGALNSTAQFIGNISLFDCVPIPSGITDPMAWAKTHWGVA